MNTPVVVVIIFYKILIKEENSNLYYKFVRMMKNFFEKDLVY